MRAFWRLCVHELCGLPAYLLCGPAAAAALMLYLTVRRHTLEPDAIFGWAMLALVLLDVLALWLGASVVQREWDSGSVYQLLSLPVSGHAIAGAKLAAALTVALVPAVMLVLGLLGIFWPGGISSFAPPLPFGVGGRYGGPSELIYAYFIFGPSIAKLFQCLNGRAAARHRHLDPLSPALASRRGPYRRLVLRLPLSRSVRLVARRRARSSLSGRHHSFRRRSHLLFRLPASLAGAGRPCRRRAPFLVGRLAFRAPARGVN
ncbi:MAG: ABC transporter permease [Bacillota bacterium]